MKEIDNIIEEHNQQLSNLIYLESNNIINLNQPSKEMIIKDTTSKITVIYNELKRKYENVKEYHNMLDVINNAMNIINGYQLKNNDNDLLDLFVKIKQVPLNYLEKDADFRMTKEFRGMLDYYKFEINNYINSFNKEEEIVKPKYKTMDEFEHVLRTSIAKQLKQLLEYVKRKDDVKKIRETMVQSMNSNYKKGQAITFGNLLDHISAEINILNSKIESSIKSEEYKQTMNQIVNIEIKESQSNEEICTNLINVYRYLIMLEEKINEELTIKRCQIRVLDIWN